MKHLIMLVIVMITLGVNTVAAKKYLQNPKTGEIIVQDVVQEFKELEIYFDSNVSCEVRTNPEIVREVLKKGNKRLSTKLLKGTYDSFILYFTSKTTSQIVYRNPDSKKDVVRISYNPSFEETNKREFAWWYLFWVMGLVVMLILQKMDTGAFSFVDAFAFAGAFAGAGAGAFASACTGTDVDAGVFAGAGVGAFTSAFVSGFVSVNNKRIKNTFAIVYYVCIITAMVCAYYQI